MCTDKNTEMTKIQHTNMITLRIQHFPEHKCEIQQKTFLNSIYLILQPYILNQKPAELYILNQCFHKCKDINNRHEKCDENKNMNDTILKPNAQNYLYKDAEYEKNIADKTGHTNHYKNLAEKLENQIIKKDFLNNAFYKSFSSKNLQISNNYNENNIDIQKLNFPPDDITSKCKSNANICNERKNQNNSRAADEISSNILYPSMKNERNKIIKTQDFLINSLDNKQGIYNDQEECENVCTKENKNKLQDFMLNSYSNQDKLQKDKNNCFLSRAVPLKNAFVDKKDPSPQLQNINPNALENNHLQEDNDAANHNNIKNSDILEALNLILENITINNNIPQTEINYKTENGIKEAENQEQNKKAERFRNLYMNKRPKNNFNESNTINISSKSRKINLEDSINQIKNKLKDQMKTSSLYTDLNVNKKYGEPDETRKHNITPK